MAGLVPRPLTAIRRGAKPTEPPRRRGDGGRAHQPPGPIRALIQAVATTLSTRRGRGVPLPRAEGAARRVRGGNTFAFPRNAETAGLPSPASEASGGYLAEEIERFCVVYFKPKQKQSAMDHQAMNAALDPAVSRFAVLQKDR